jgi:hypothetical protein
MGVTTSSSSAATYVPIATTTLGSAAASYTFSSIPSTYTDLVLITNETITTPVSASLFLRFNGDTGNNYSNTDLYGNGTSAGSARDTSIIGIRFGAINNGSGNLSNSTVNIMNYANTTTYKTVLSRFSDAGAESSTAVGLWRNTAAITSITLYLASTSTYGTNSTFTLFGIKAA